MNAHMLPAVASLALSAAPALAQEIRCYRLTDASTWQEGCLDPCDCILWPEVPLQGTFRLTLQSASQLEVIYNVTDVRFEAFAPPPADPPRRTFTGSGTYRRTRSPGANPSHSLSLDLTVDAGPPRKFASLPALDPLQFPNINLEIADNDFVCYNIILDLRAVPACPCERTCDDVTDVFDLLAYLDLWFALDPAANLDDDPAINVSDLLAYLDCWFTSCA